MKPLRISLTLALAVTVGLLVGLQPAAQSQEKTIKIGLIYDFYGVKFLGEGNPMRGQNERAFPAVYQVVDGKFAIVYPKAFANASPILPLPPSSPFAAR